MRVFSNLLDQTLGSLSLVALCMFATAQAKTLDLPTTPLFTGSTVKPNIMVAIDDSGSMDFETLFPTTSGLLYWNSDRDSVLTGSQYTQDSSYGYAYLFPNGFNNCDNNGNCDSRDRRIYSNYYAVPPIPALAFARSPEYNSAYFDPSATYTPWAQKNSVQDLSNVPSDPTTGSSRFNLKDPNGIKIYANGYTFAVFDDTPFGNVTYADGYVCTRYEYYWYGGRYCTEQAPNWSTSSRNAVFSGNQLIGIQYFPATFYLKSGTSLPSGYGWKSNASTLTGKAPDASNSLVGYEIRPENFTSTAAYTAALQNFANWFTYYRKRHLAVRGGISNAFEQISGARVGSCTINGRSSLTMRDLDVATDRSNFYSTIFNTDFSIARGTPNRKGLQFLGQQLVDNQSIITSPCQQNFGILFTDGYNTDTVLSKVGNADGDDGAPYSDSYENTIADVSRYYYESLPTLRNNTIARGQMRLPSGCNENNPDPRLDCQKDLHMVSFGVTLDQRGVIYDPTNPIDAYQNTPRWPNPNSGNYGLEQIDDLWHATINSKGALLNATTPEKVADAFVAALEQIINSNGSASGVAANSGTLTNDSTIFQASFIGGLWNGDLKAYASASAQTDSDPSWSAAKQLNNMLPNNRVVLTNVPSGSATTANNGYTPKAFRYANLSSAQKDTLTEAQLNYIRGDRSNERGRADNGSFRNRQNNILGDIIDSAPLYVGAPNRYRYPLKGGWRDLRQPKASAPENSAASYSDPASSGSFAQANSNRTPMVYVGANDGMLHGFDAKTGKEKLSFIPATVVPSLSKLSETNYVHSYYVNGSPVEGDAVFGGSWHTVLVGGLSQGGKGIYALDVTNPGTFAESNPGTVLWEFSDSELGFTYGKPSIVRLHNGKWAAMFGNGYNSSSQKASLFLVDIQTGAQLKRIDTGEAASSNSTPGNGLGPAFPVDLDGDFITDYAYAGDLNGNVWKFDLTASSSSGWIAKKLFTAKSPSGASQPITTQPQVGIHPYGRNYGVIVYFGTGKYLENGDAAQNTSLQNSFYGIWDLDVFTFNEANNGQPMFATSLKTSIPRDRLVTQTLTTQNVNNQMYRFVSDNPVNYQQTPNDNGARGWVLNLSTNSGEMVNTAATLQGDTVAFNTFVPSVQSCTSGGSGYFMLLDRATGGRTNFLSFDLNGDSKFNAPGDTVTINGGSQGASGVALTQGTLGSPKLAVGKNGATTAVISMLGTGTQTINIKVDNEVERRMSWREIRR